MAAVNLLGLDQRQWAVGEHGVEAVALDHTSAAQRSQVLGDGLSCEGQQLLGQARSRILVVLSV